MKDVEEFIENEISIEELVTFLVEEVYRNYPDFIELFGSEKNIKELLFRNIRAIKRVPKEVEDGEAARYNVIEGEICFYSKEKIDVDTLRKDNDMKHIIVHESIHALLNRTKNKSNVITGCASCTSRNKKVIRGTFDEVCKFYR